MTADSAGHLFVTHGDLSRIAADHVIVPCDNELRFTSSFAELVGGPQEPTGRWIRRSDLDVPEGFSTADRLPLRLKGTKAPQVWLFNSAVSGAASQADDLSWLQSGLRSAFATIPDSATPPIHDRERPLIALPLVGVGEGGFREIRGQTIVGILRTLKQIAAEPGHPDIILVTWRRSDYAEVLTRALGGSENTQRLVASLIHTHCYALSHSLLASMRLPEAVTTNYDDLYEKACQRPQPSLRVLPRQGADGQSPWLVKLHGDVQVPQSIILSGPAPATWSASTPPGRTGPPGHPAPRSR